LGVKRSKCPFFLIHHIYWSLCTASYLLFIFFSTILACVFVFIVQALKWLPSGFPDVH
jgi:hypothetical protein